LMGYDIISRLEELGYNLELKPGRKINISLKPGFKPDPQKAEELINELKANKDEIIKYLSLTEEEAFNLYIEELREKNRYDPRPDLKEDHDYWQAVLKEAEKLDKQIYSNLHGFRCAGCRLKIEGDGLRLFPAVGPGQQWKDKREWIQDRQEHLLPYAKEIKEIFEKVSQKIYFV